MTLNDTQKQTLLAVAKASIEHGFRTGRPLQGVRSEDDRLNEPGAAFVTLNRHGQLRGCIGS
uniref:AMMECR1 domain-containing protein n=1 Tax=Sulfurivirga sp. TaxID=2614236 RepID=UPI0025DB258C